MSKQSKRNGDAKSLGKSSQGPNSFAASQKGGMGGTAKSANTAGPNIVIDIESESLTYN